MGIDEELIKKEEASLNKKLKQNNPPTDEINPNVEGEVLADSITKEARKIEDESRAKIQKLIREQVARELAKPRDVRITNTPKVFVTFPEVQKVAGIRKLIDATNDLREAIQDQPDIQKVSGTVKAVVAFPDVQTIVGRVKAEVDFPSLQKIEGTVKALIEFPSEYNVVGKVTTDLPQVEMGNRHVVPVSIWDGKRFINSFTSASVQSNGRVVSAIERLIAVQSGGAVGSNVVVTDIKDGAGDSIMDTANNAMNVSIVAGGSGNGAILDGVDSLIKATVKDLSNSNPLATAIVDASGDQITSFGGGTQYAEGAVSAVPTGTVEVWQDTGGVMHVASPGRPLPISGSVRGNVTVSGTTTVSGGAYGNRSLLQQLDLSLSKPLAIAIVDTTGAQFTGDQSNGLDVDVTRVGGNVTVIQGTGTNLHVVLDAASAAFGKLAANDGVDIGDVTINNASGGSAVNIQDGGNSITIDGTITANAGSGTFTISGAVTNTVLSVVGGGAEATAQRVTIANDSTGLLSVDDNGSSLTVDGTVSLGAGAASIGILGANSGVDIGDVTINNASGGSAVNIQDGGNSITIDGTVAISGTVTVDTELPAAAALADATVNPTTPSVGSLTMIFDPVANVWNRARGEVNFGIDVDVTRSVQHNVTVSGVSGTVTVSGGLYGNRALTQQYDLGSGIEFNKRHPEAVAIVDGSGNIVTSFGGSGGTSMSDDAAFTPGTTSITPIGGTYRSVRDAVDDNDGGAFAMTAKRAVYVSLETPLADSAMDDTADAVKIIGQANSGVDIGDVTINNASGGAAVNIQDGGNTITVDGTVILGAGSASIGILGANSGVDIGDVTINNASGGSAVNIQDGGNTITVDGTVTVTDGLNIEGDVAHAGSDSGNPVKIGGKAYATPPAPVADAQRVNAYWDQAGRLQVESRNVERSDIVGGSGNVPLTPLRYPINTSGFFPIRTLISGLANRKIRVLNGVLMAKSTVTVQLKSNNNSDATGPMYLGSAGGFQIPEAEIGNFDTQTGEALTVVLSSPVAIGGWLTAVYV